MKRFSAVALPLALAVVLGSGLPAVAQDEWKFGIGTGISSFSLDGDIGFPLSGGGAVIFDVDLDNSDTADLVESGLGLGGYASKGKWTILYRVGTSTLEDEDGGLDAEWDRTNVAAYGVYNFARTGKHGWGALFGFRFTDHEWDFKTATSSASIEEDWTDGVVGATHRMPISERWAWSNLLDAGFGDSEGSYTISSTITWMPTRHWSFSLALRQYSVEFGEMEDIGKSDFYLYDIDEPAVTVGFMYNW